MEIKSVNKEKTIVEKEEKVENGKKYFLSKIFNKNSNKSRSETLNKSELQVEKNSALITITDQDNNTRTENEQTIIKRLLDTVKETKTETIFKTNQGFNLTSKNNIMLDFDIRNNFTKVIYRNLSYSNDECIEDIFTLKNSNQLKLLLGNLEKRFQSKQSNKTI